MKYLIVLLVASAFSIAWGQPYLNFLTTCGHRGNNRIVGGQVSLPHSIPWQAAVFSTGPRASGCSGSLITQTDVLLAAHCEEANSNYIVWLGAHDISKPTEPGRVEMISNVFITHDGWDPSTRGHKDDIAIIVLPHKVPLSDTINVACLPRMDLLQLGMPLTTSGWGQTSDSQPTESPVLRWVQLPQSPKDVCQMEYMKDPSRFPTDFICLNTSGGQSSCKGDSGAPVSKFNYERNQWEVYGLVSFGSDRGCELGLPVVATKVSLYSSWISDTAALII